MKKIKFLLPCVLISVFLSACGSEQAADSKTTKETAHVEEQITGECEYCGKTAPLFFYKINTEQSKSSGDLICEECAENSKKFHNDMAALGLDMPYTLKKYTG